MSGPPPIPWLHETHDSRGYRWVEQNRLMRDPETGQEITYRMRNDQHVICGARTMRPGIDGFTKRYPWRSDQSVPHEVVCTVVGDHAEVPHIGVPAECADMKCECGQHGSYHLVIVGFAIRPLLEQGDA